MSYVQNRVTMLVQVAHIEDFSYFHQKSVGTRERRSPDCARENFVSFVRMETSRLSPWRDEITEVSLEISISGLAPLTRWRNLRE